MTTLQQRLQEREEAAHRRVVQLREHVARLAEELAAAEEALNRLIVTRETVAGILSEDEGQADTARLSSSPTGVRLVPHRTPDTPFSELPLDYRDVMEVLARAAGPLRAKDISAAVGRGDSAVTAERMRSRLNRLAARGWILKTGDGAFTLDPAARALANGTI